MATMKFEVGKVYIAMNDKFGDGEGKGKSAVISRTETTVVFKHLASGEEFEREVIKLRGGVDCEMVDAFDANDSIIADNLGEEITDYEMAGEVKATDEVKIPAEREVKAVIATIAEKHGFEMSDWYVKTKAPAIMSVAYLNGVSLAYIGNKSISKIKLRYSPYSFTAKTAEEFLEQAEFLSRLAQFAKDIEGEELIYRDEWYAVNESSGVILESGDETLIKKYVEVLQGELANQKREAECYQNELADIDQQMQGKRKRKTLEVLQERREQKTESLQKVQANVGYLEGELKKAETILQKSLIDKCRAKVAEQKSKPKKSIIDWSELDEEVGEPKKAKAA